MLSKRQSDFLHLVVENYIETAEPIGSQFLVKAEGLNLSGATVRNELRDLEETGFLTHPHTSAGRIPTEAGYRYYIENIMAPEKIKKSQKEHIESIFIEGENSIKAVKEFAKYLAELSQNAVIVSFGEESIYYTGLSNLFSQPELKDYSQSVNISLMFDQCETKLPEISEMIDNEIKYFVGTDNPLGKFCGSVVIKKNDIMIAFVGPIRMKYARCFGLAEVYKDLNVNK